MNIDPNQIVALASIAIYFLVRVAKGDTTIPVTIPPRWRFWLALGLGAASGALERVVAGTPWGPAIAGGIAAAAFAVMGHNALVDSINGGKELPILPPSLIVPGAAPSPGKPPTIPLPEIADRDTPVLPPPGVAS